MLKKLLTAVTAGGLVAAVLFDVLVGPFIGGLFAGYIFSKSQTRNAEAGIAAGIFGIGLYVVIAIIPIIVESRSLSDILVFEPLPLLMVGILIMSFSIFTSAIGGIIGGKLSSGSGVNIPTTS